MNGNNGGGIFLENGPKSAAEAEQEGRVNAVVEKILADARNRRRVLNLQEICDMQDFEPFFEQYYPDINAYFYTINGTLKGEQVRGAMFAGNCILVFARNRKEADEIAKSGLLDTIKFAQQHAMYTHLGVDPQQILDQQHANDGVLVDAKGKRILH
jgi:superfamily II DNA/RNA helicase